MTDPTPERLDRVLIVKPSALGDVVTAMPVLRGLRRTFGRDLHVGWMVNMNCADLIAHDSDLDDCIPFDRKGLAKSWRSVRTACALGQLLARLRRGRYDWVIDLQGLLRSSLFARVTGASVRAGFANAREGARWFYTHKVPVEADRHTVDRNVVLAGELGIDARGEDMTLQVAPRGVEFAEAFVAEHDLGERFIICVPPTRWATKLYPVRHWRKVVGRLARDVPVVIVGAPGDGDLCAAVADGAPDGVVNAAGQTDVAQMVGLIAASGGVICCDSSAKFIAPAVGVDVVTLIGPTRVERTGPYLRGRPVVADVACQGCLRKQCRHITCMESIDPEAVIAAAGEMLKRESN